MAEYQRGEGPEALPYGGAAQVNEATPDVPEGADEIPVIFAPGGEEPIPNEVSGSDDLKLLLDPPNPNYQRNLVPKERPGRVPKYVIRHLASLRAAATAPDAPPTLRAYYNAVLRHLENERRMGR